MIVLQCFVIFIVCLQITKVTNKVKENNLTKNNSSFDSLFFFFRSIYFKLRLNKIKFLVTQAPSTDRLYTTNTNAEVTNYICMWAAYVGIEGTK